MKNNSRRDFLRTATTSVGLVLSAPVIVAILSSCEENETTAPPTGKKVVVDISTFTELSAPGGIVSTVVTGLNADNRVFISRVSDTEFVVFSTICTHQGCEVGSPAMSGMHCVCPCHNAMYSHVDGKILRQPSSGSATDLPKFVSEFNSSTNILTISA
ncbi:MAG: Rieske 2Fe-2S domain-containing protein [Ignavibacteria bacterium]|nr:Rieske 2Fe-2S domain-containing protein [Ignavibacteria bacterium]